MKQSRAVKPRRKPAKKARSSLVYLAPLGLILGLIAAGIYWNIDERVAKRLASPDNPAVSAIYSDMTTVDLSQGFNPDLLRTELMQRRYREVPTDPSAAGEFHLTSDELDLVTREFRGPDGLVHPLSKIKVRLSDPSTWSKFYLEPEVVSVLGGGDIKASESLPLERFPIFLRQAVVSIEDERFRSHHGIDLSGIARAFWENLKALSIVQGGSTITQQLAKNLFLSPERSLGRKFVELFAAFSLENRLSKDQILELYLNEVYLGQEGSVAIHGCAKAAQIFFGKNVSDLTLPEAALLAGMIRAPSLYSPRRHPERAKERRDVVLQKMAELQIISPAEAARAIRTPIDVIAESVYQRRAPHFSAYLQNDLEDLINVEAAVAKGARIYTGIDLEMQKCAEAAVQAGLEDLEHTHPALLKHKQKLESGLIAIEPFSGKVRAWVGGRDYSDNQFDHVAQARRQIGSTVKPFLYLTALDRTLNNYKVATALSVLMDRPMNIKMVNQDTWEPENYDREFHGDVTLRYAVENSLNLPAVYTAEKFGIPTLARTLSRFGLGDKIVPVPALALGALDTSLLQLTGAYAALANGGAIVWPRLFISIYDQDGQRLALSPIQEQQLADENAVYVLTDILRGVVERGTARNVRRAGYNFPVAGKTGTSNDARDNWFVGFTPDLAAGVWVGFDDNSKIGLTGGSSAAPIWTRFMQCVTKFHTPSDFVAPPGVVSVEVNPSTGRLVTPDCPADNAVREVFVRGTEPALDCGRFVRNQPERKPEPDARPQAPNRARRSFWESLFDW